ncbi:MAG: L(+)-tartrate dehydratase subunit beta [Eubacterium sp.]|nr:L(+)-tartrate dehydratase subunit beta [Eubacterium sp.]
MREETEDKKIVLTTPITDEDILSLRTGDVIYVTGLLVTGRDAMHERMLRGDADLSVDLQGGVLYHAGPIMKEKADEPGKYELVACGPTTSMRMESVEAEFLEKTGVKVLIGKGGMGEKTAAACWEKKAIHTVFPGGCAVLAAACVEEVEGVEWADLGMPEAAWILRAKEFGPLVVSIDTEGNNLFAENRELFRVRKEAVL